MLALPAELYPHVFENPVFVRVPGIFDFYAISFLRGGTTECLRSQLSYTPTYLYICNLLATQYNLTYSAKKVKYYFYQKSRRYLLTTVFIFDIINM